MKKETDHKEETIKEIPFTTENIRLRPEMYVGTLNQKGCLGLLKTIIANHKTKEVKLEFKDHSSASIYLSFINKEVINHWTKWIAKANSFNGYELLTLNALSRDFSIRFFDQSSALLEEISFQKGNLTSGKDIEQRQCSSMKIEFTLDREIWKDDFRWSASYISHELRAFAYLFKEVKFDLQFNLAEEEGYQMTYYFSNGLKDRLDIEILNGSGKSYFQSHILEQIGDLYLEVAFAFRELSVDESFLLSYVNDERTSEHGTHVDALLQGLTYGVMKYFQKHELTQTYKISEKGMREGLLLALHFKMEAPVYSGCVRNKLANAEIIKPIADFIADYLFEKMEKNADSTQKLIARFAI